MTVSSVFFEPAPGQCLSGNPAASLSAPKPAAPRWRVLAGLAMLVLAAHTWVLKTAPGRFGPELDPAPSRVPALVTRRIEIAPPAGLTAPVPVNPARPVAKPVRNPVLKKKELVAQPVRAQQAIELIATPLAAATPAADGSAEVSAPDTQIAPATKPASPASADAAASPPAIPAGPSVTAVTAMALPASVQLKYKMTGLSKGLTYHANGELSWRNAGSSYDAYMSVSALFLGSRSLASRGQVSAEGLAPTRFSDKSRTEVAAHFEPDKGQISFSANTPSAPWIKGAQDRVTVFLQLGGMLAGNPAGFPPGASISLYTVGPRNADTWTFIVEAEEQMSLPAGEMATLKLTRKPRGEYDQKVEIWYAPALGYLPVRSKITQQNGDYVDQQLSAIHPL